MSGHSKWSKIKRKKGATDSKRSQAFSRISKEITIAAQQGGADESMNPRLRLAIQNAKGVNMPKDVILRAISKADKDSASLEELTYEGHGPGGVAIFVECLSDNSNRTVANIRSSFTKSGGNLGTKGSLSFIFTRRGIFTIPEKSIKNLDDFELDMIDAGADDFEVDSGSILITSAFEDFGKISMKLEEKGIEAESQELQRIPNTTIKLNVDEARKVIRLIDRLEEDEDVQKVFHNLEMTDEIMAMFENE
jgi:YebC/PmpR family DNA-binding regulatory protein